MHAFTIALFSLTVIALQSFAYPSIAHSVSQEWKTLVEETSSAQSCRAVDHYSYRVSRTLDQIINPHVAHADVFLVVFSLSRCRIMCEEVQSRWNLYQFVVTIVSIHLPFTRHSLVHYHLGFLKTVIWFCHQSPLLLSSRQCTVSPLGLRP